MSSCMYNYKLGIYAIKYILLCAIQKASTIIPCHDPKVVRRRKRLQEEEEEGGMVTACSRAVSE